ncbi:MAG: DUF3500 domain-containing protein [Pseudomonadota bacterium]
MRMNRRTMLAGTTAAAVVAASPLRAQAATTQAADAAAMRAAAADFLAAMGGDGGAAFAFDGPERTDWHWFPQRFFSRREGVYLKAMSANARDAALGLLRASTTPDGFAKANAIMRLQEKLGRDAGDFQVSVYGRPDAGGAWGWSLEGHHLSLNYTIVGDRIAAGPLFIGARPTLVPEWTGVDRAPMAVEEATARDLLLSLDRARRARALYSARTPGDTVTRSSSKVDALPKVGLPLSELPAGERARAMTVVREYLASMPPSLSAETFATVERTPDDDLWFGWSGAAEDGLYYYRLSGPGWFIEHDNSRNNATHIHSVWRDIDGDFGRALI